VEVVVERAELLRGLSDVGHTVGKHLDLYERVQLDAEGGRLALSTSDGEAGTKVEVEAAVDAPGRVSVEYDLLNRWAGAVQGGIIKMRLEEGGLRCQCGRQWARLPAKVEEDFLGWPKLGEPIVEMDAFHIAPAVEAVVWATVDRPPLDGVLWKFCTGVVTLQAADGIAASEYKFSARPLRGFEDTQAILCLSAMQALRKVADSEVQVAVGSGKVMFKFEGGEVYSRTTDLNWPQLTQIIDAAMDGMVWEAKRIGLVGLVDLADIFAAGAVTRAGAGWIQFAWIPGDPASVKATAQNVEVGDFDGSIETEPGEGEEVSFNVSGKLLLAALKSMAGPTVQFHFRDAKHAIGLEDNNYQHRVAIMPMHIA
jgi:DNA polymerase III sliding clamp (beta) subunit (PCNA family)